MCASCLLCCVLQFLVKSFPFRVVTGREGKKVVFWKILIVIDSWLLVVSLFADDLSYSTVVSRFQLFTCQVSSHHQSLSKKYHHSLKEGRPVYNSACTQRPLQCTHAHRPVMFGFWLAVTAVFSHLCGLERSPRLFFFLPPL